MIRKTTGRDTLAWIIDNGLEIDFSQDTTMPALLSTVSQWGPW